MTNVAFSFTVVKMKNHLDGWQPLTRAAKQAKVSRQWLSTLAKNNLIPKLLINGGYWVKDPLKYLPDRKRQRRAKDSA